MDDNEMSAARDLIDFARATPEQRQDPRWKETHLESARVLECYLDGTDPNHEAKWCERKGCEEEATRWYEDPNAKDKRTMYVCLEHIDIQAAEEGGMITNSAGKLVELGVYACSEECTTCNQ